jgi:hypothetical protein
MLDQISNVYVGSDISNRLYSVNDLVWPDTTGNLWKVIDNPYNKTISNFNVTYVGGQVDINWGAVISGNISSATNINHTFSGITRSGISVISKNGASITQINCGTSSPKLSGNINLSAFPDLQQFRCNNNDITAISGYENNSNLIIFQFQTNQITGSILSLTGLTNLRDFYCFSNQITGPIPSLSGLTNLQDFACYSNQFTGPIPSLSGLSNLRFFRCNDNQITGSIPNLIGLNNLQNFYCYSNQLSGSIPNLSGLTNLRDFRCNDNQITGSIPNLSGLNNLQNFVCYSNQLTGSIPNLSGLNNLQTFYCYSNQLTGFVSGEVSNTLGNFQAQDNQLRSTSVNDILRVFVVANKTIGTRTLNLGGAGNFSPNGQGITDKATLISRGWTVTTN